MAKQSFAGMMAAIVALERQVSEAAAQANPDDEMRVYEWRPSGYPELPALWNWIDDGSYEIVDTARGDDIVVVTATIGVRPADLGETMGRLMRLTDIFRTVVDPALNKRPLNESVRYAKRVTTRSHIEDFNGEYVMCMNLLMRCELTANIGGIE
jgi:hypothetical protein